MVVGAQKRAQLYKSHQAPHDDHLCLKLWLLHCTNTNVQGKCLVNWLVLCVPINLNNTNAKICININNPISRQMHLSRGRTSVI